MPKRTLNGFLKTRLLALGGPKSQSISKLCANAVNSENGEMRDVVFLLALEWHKLPELVAAAAGTCLEDEWSQQAKHAGRYKSAYAYLNFCPRATAGQKALFEEYETLTKGKAANNTSLEEVRVQIAEELEKSHITRYRLCKDLGINIGNTYAFLKGDLSKSSEANALRMLAYLKDQAQ